MIDFIEQVRWLQHKFGEKIPNFDFENRGVKISNVGTFFAVNYWKNDNLWNWCFRLDGKSYDFLNQDKNPIHWLRVRARVYQAYRLYADLAPEPLDPCDKSLWLDHQYKNKIIHLGTETLRLLDFSGLHWRWEYREKVGQLGVIAHIQVHTSEANQFDDPDDYLAIREALDRFYYHLSQPAKHSESTPGRWQQLLQKIGIR